MIVTQQKSLLLQEAEQCKGQRADLIWHALLHVCCHDGVNGDYGRLHIAAAAQQVLKVLLSLRPVTLHCPTPVSTFLVKPFTCLPVCAGLTSKSVLSSHPVQAVLIIAAGSFVAGDAGAI